MPTKSKKAPLYKRYPQTSVLIYNGSTVIHFLLGGMGIIIGYTRPAWAGYLFGGAYLVFAFAEMYLLMPLVVCRNCVYFRMGGALCISGLNVWSRKITSQGKPKDFSKRGEGLFCPNNLYMASLAIPILALIPALIINFSVVLLVIELGLVSLLLYRFFVIFPKLACLHCQAKFNCPQAEAMGVREL